MGRRLGPTIPVNADGGSRPSLLNQTLHILKQIGHFRFNVDIGPVQTGDRATIIILSSLNDYQSSGTRR